jgi:hypothetical protein
LSSVTVDPATRDKRSSLVIAGGIVFVAAIYGAWLHASLPVLRFSPDSWGYFELAKTLNSPNPFRFVTFRSYWSSAHSAAFPFGYPAVLAAVHRLFGERPEHAVGLNIVLATLTPLAAGALTRRLVGDFALGAVCSLSLLLYMPYLTEVFAGRSIPLAVLLILLAAALITQSDAQHSWRSAAAAGLMAGLAVQVRFDALGIFLLLGAYCLMERRRALHLTGYLIAGFAALAPWAAYSLQHFGVLWATDNAWVALATSQPFVTDYPARSTSTLVTDPAAWVAKISANALRLIGNALRAMAQYAAIPTLLLVTAVAASRRSRDTRRPLITRPLLLVLVALLALAPQIATGYFDLRYYSLLLLTVCLWLAARLCAANGQAWPPRTLLYAIMLAASSLHPIGATLQTLRNLDGLRKRDAEDARIVDRLAQCHQAEPATFYVVDDAVVASRLGATRGVRSGLLPNNWASLDESARGRFADEFQPVRFITTAKLRSESKGVTCACATSPDGSPSCSSQDGAPTAGDSPATNTNR